MSGKIDSSDRNYEKRIQLLEQEIYESNRVVHFLQKELVQARLQLAQEQESCVWLKVLPDRFYSRAFRLLLNPRRLIAKIKSL